MFYLVTHYVFKTQNQMTKPEYVSVVKRNQKPCLQNVFGPVIGKQMKNKKKSPKVINFERAFVKTIKLTKKKKKKYGALIASVVDEQPPTGPHVPHTRSMTLNGPVVTPPVEEV